MTQVNMGIGNAIFSNLGPMRGQYVFFFCMFFLLSICFLFVS